MPIYSYVFQNKSSNCLLQSFFKSIVGIEHYVFLDNFSNLSTLIKPDVIDVLNAGNIFPCVTYDSPLQHLYYFPLLLGAMEIKKIAACKIISICLERLH